MPISLSSLNLNCLLNVELLPLDKPLLQIALKSRLRCPSLPLAIYREVAAHLGQVDGITVELIPQRSQQFDYRLSQIDSLQIHYLPDADPSCYGQVQRILAYYGDRYSAWEAVNSD